MSLDAARLATWDARERARRVGPRARLAAPLGGLVAAAAMIALAQRSGAGEARVWWTIGVAVAGAGVVMRAPYRMFWHPTATLLARLPVPGEALWGLALRRSLVAGAHVALVLAMAAATAVLDGDAAGALRGVAAALGTGLAGALLAPTVGALAGGLVASERARVALASVAAESSAPPLAWLSILPALGGGLAGLAGWTLAAWAVTGEAEAGVRAAEVAGGVLAVALALVVVGRKRLAAALPAATREVAALDAVRLATLQLDKAQGLEAIFGRVFAGGGAAGAMYRKDVALARRRYPLFFLLSGLGLLILWLAAIFAEPSARARWALGGGAALVAYLAVFGARLPRPDIERPRLLEILPLPRPAVVRAKLVFIAWRLVFIAAATAPAIVRSPAPASALIALSAALAAGTLVASLLAARR